MSTRTWLAAAALSLAAPLAAQEPPGDPLPDPVEALLDEIESLRGQVAALRAELAAARTEASEARRALAEIQQFIQDHHELGDAFRQYTAIKEVVEREARRLRSGQREAERLERARAAGAQRAAAQSEARRAERYREAGFWSVGENVYVGLMAYHYRGVNQVLFEIDYDPFLGIRYPRPYPSSQVDFSSMTLSGSVVNAAEELRNIGIAVVFFDEAGSQVGGQIIQVNNARPDVPYPFTSTVQMALDRPFASSSTYVLYADPAASPPPDPPPDPTAHGSAVRSPPAQPPRS
jgi:hypothetical protein